MSMINTLSAAELQRRGITAIEEGLTRGPLHLVKNEEATAVILSTADYQRLLRLGEKSSAGTPSAALEWLLAIRSTGQRDKADIDAGLADERAW
ncbi:MAG: hypothetical protein Q4D91_07475 [Lautropia sp.]|nr:hypothetical protein [Lautropia sp.]